MSTNDDEIELAILKTCTAQHKAVETSSGKNADKCVREVDIRIPIRGVTGAQGSELDYLAALWIGRLAPSTPGVSKGVLRPCSNSERNRASHRYNARAFTDAINNQPAPAWERIRYLEDKLLRGNQLPQKELEQKFGILLSAAQEQKDFEEWRSTCSAIGVLFSDIDNFKRLNENHTETTIDATILPDFQNLLKRLTDHRGGAYRHGGEEFVILLPNHDINETCAFAEKVRAAIEAYEFRIDQETITVTVSVGIALWPDHGSDFSKVMAAANRAEHGAKKQGRNRIEVAVHPTG